ncbi:hypothetical protein GCM10010236_69470 [Streptomyces eurythermus]|nr:hypothetical protein GCM10010236_69470 [Streptomyces eurythermus]
MAEITYVRGDATVPSGKGVKVIAHVCDDIGPGAVQPVRVEPDDHGEGGA